MTERRVVDLDAVRRDLAAAEPVGGPKPARPDGLPDDCPVQALGTHAGVYSFLDALRQFRPIGAKDLGRLVIMDLFAGRTDYVWTREAWCRVNKDGDITGWRPEAIQEELFNACARAGIFDPSEQVRGRGCWRDATGDLVWHCGDVILSRSGRAILPHPPGFIGRYVYPAAPAIERPALERVPATVIEPLRALVCRWNWRRPDLDPVLLLGFLGCAMLSGALSWRPTVWITGDRGCGKSTLWRDVILACLGGGAVTSKDATEAALRQIVGVSSLPVIIDELERTDDNRRASGVIRLARLASDESVSIRGGKEGNASSWTVRSCFGFSSVYIPPLDSASASRIAILDLLPLGGRGKLSIDADEMRILGSAIRGRLWQEWPRLAETIGRYATDLRVPADGLAALDSRGSDVFATLLAVAEVLLYDDPDERSGDDYRWAERLRSAEATRNDATEALERGVLQDIISRPVDPMRSGLQRTIAQWIELAAGRESGDPTQARDVIGTYGLGVKVVDGQQYLAVANAHAGLSNLLRGTEWAPTAGTQAGWIQPLRRLAGAWGGVEMSGTMRFAGVPSRAVLLPLARALPDPDGREGNQRDCNGGRNGPLQGSGGNP